MLLKDTSTAVIRLTLITSRDNIHYNSTLVPVTLLEYKPAICLKVPTENTTEYDSCNIDLI